MHFNVRAEAHDLSHIELPTMQQGGGTNRVTVEQQYKKVTLCIEVTVEQQYKKVALCIEAMFTL